MKKTKTICFANNKGGSGKSTTCSNVGYGLRELGYKVLLIDGDMQLNLSLSLFDEDQVLAFAQSDKNLYEGLKRQDDLSDYIVHSEYEGLDLIPSSTLMSSIEYELFTKWQREFILRKCLQKVKESGAYDYILIDAPPTLGGWVMNILCASDEIVITKVDTRKSYFKQTLETLKSLEDVPVFDTYIRVDSGIEWSQDNNAPIMAYKKSSRSAKEYMELTKEIAKME